MEHIAELNTLEFKNKIQSIAGPVFAYKDEVATWRFGRKAINSRGLLYRANKSYFRHCKLAKKHLVMVQPNLKITNSPFAREHLVYLDLDTKNGFGTENDVLKLNEFLILNFFPEMGQPLINSRGGSNWLVVDCVKRLRPGYFSTVDPEEYNATLKAFGLALDKLANYLGLTFSEVDTYGSLPVYVKQGSEVIAVKTNNKLLFKCPPSEQFISQTISYARLVEIVGQIESLVATQSPSGQIVSVPPVAPKVKGPGSSFEHAEARIEGIYKTVMVDNSRPTEVVCGKKKRYISARMLAEYIYALSCLRKNSDGSMPHRRVGAFVSMMYCRGVFNHGYDPSVLTAVRNWLSSKGLIVWEDNTYSTGRACKWEMKKEVKEAVKTIHLSSLPYFVSTQASTDYLKPKFREEKPMPEGWQDYVESFAWTECGF